MNILGYRVQSACQAGLRGPYFNCIVVGGERRLTDFQIEGDRKFLTIFTFWAEGEADFAIGFAMGKIKG